jgi:predicted lipid carrier protein YhbT
MKLRWMLVCRERQPAVLPTDTAADCGIRGDDAVDFLLSLGRVEDPDALFLQRRMQSTGDTVIGLTTRNPLDRLCWHDLPPALRIVVDGAARVGRCVRETRIRRQPAAVASGPHAGCATNSGRLVSMPAVDYIDSAAMKLFRLVPRRVSRSG